MPVFIWKPHKHMHAHNAPSKKAKMNAKISQTARETASSSTFIHDLKNIPIQTNPELMVIKQKRRHVRRGASAWINPRMAPRNHLIAVGNYKNISNQSCFTENVSVEGVTGQNDMTVGLV